MNNEFFYCLWALPLIAAVLNKAAARYAFTIMAPTYFFDLGSENFSNDVYFLSASILDLLFIYIMPEMPVAFTLSCVLNSLQFAFGSFYELTGNFTHFKFIITLQFFCLLKIKDDNSGLGGFDFYVKNFSVHKFNFFSNKGVASCKKT